MSLWLCGMLLIGCALSEETGVPQLAPPVQNGDERGEEEPQDETPFRAPLTGLPVEEPLYNRVVGVLIENHNQARPQSGLHQADWVFEVLAEGWITRFAAVYQSAAPDFIGPVRSVRPYFIDILEGLGAVIVHAGGSPEALDILKRTKYDHLDEIYGSGTYFWRESFRRPPHNLYTDMAKLRQAIRDKGYAEMSGPLPELQFLREGEELPGGQPADRVDILYHNTYDVSYRWDGSSYQRLVKGEPHVDLRSKTPLQAANLIIMEAPHRIVDGEGRRQITLTGSGRALLLQRGQVYPVSWTRTDGQFFVFLYNQMPIKLVPGQTWVNIIPDKPGLDTAVKLETGMNENGE